MAEPRHLELLKQGRDAWNEWRKMQSNEIPDLREADLRGENLSEFNLCDALLAQANLSGANLRGTLFEHAKLSFDKYMYPFPDERVGAILSGADAREAKFHYADLSEVDFIGADLRHAVFIHANLGRADLSDANLSGATFLMSDLLKTRMTKANLAGADLEFARLSHCDLTNADLTGARVYGTSVWDVNLSNCKQTDLIVSPDPYPKKETTAVTVDSLELAQFMHLLLSNEKIRTILDTMTSKIVLILGRFTQERKAVLDAIRDELRQRDFAPVLFDFDKPDSKDVTGTVETLARMARFVIADLTDPSSIPHELATTVPFLRTTPVLPLRLAGTGGYSMFTDLQRSYPWVLPIHEYKDSPSLISSLSELITPVEAMAENFRKVP